MNIEHRTSNLELSSIELPSIASERLLDEIHGRKRRRPPLGALGGVLSFVGGDHA